MTGYMKEMRKLVGHRTIIQCAASIICVDADNNILLGRRSDNHMLGYAGGSVEIDEHVEDCARRELFEEMGIVAQKLEFFCVNSGPETHYIYPNGDEVSNIEIIYVCKEWEGIPKSVDGEMADLKFYPPAEIILDEVSPPIRHVIASFVHKISI